MARRVGAGVVGCLMTAWLGFVPGPAAGCDNPVYRYALENWEAGDFLLRAAPADRGLLGRELQELARRGPRPNLQLLETAADDPDHPVAAAELVLLAPPAEEHSTGPAEVWRGPAEVWRGPAAADALARIVESPARREIGKRLLAGEAIVWVVVEAGEQGLADGLERLETLVTNYIQTVTAQDEALKAAPPPVVPGVPAAEPIDKSAFWPPRMSVLRVRADDPEERVLGAMLKAVLEQPAAAGPLVYPVFGRGRVLGGIPLGELDAAKFRSASDFLTGACSCEVKEMNPGRDLLFVADWDSVPKVTRQPGALSLSELEVGEEIVRPPAGLVHERFGVDSPPVGAEPPPPQEQSAGGSTAAPAAGWPAPRLAFWMVAAAGLLFLLSFLARARR